jgi:hypothetical protein
LGLWKGSETTLPGIAIITQTKDKVKENAPSGKRMKERKKRKGQKIKKKGSRYGWHVF